MQSAYISALFGLIGALVGGISSFWTTWATQRAQLREQHRAGTRIERERLFTEFISEASRLYGDALTHQRDEVTALVGLYALVARMRLFASREVIIVAEKVMDTIIQTYLGPNRSLHEVRRLAEAGEMNFLVDFGEACRSALLGT